MSQASTDQIIAHVDLIRAVDRLLEQAQLVRDKREILARLLPAHEGSDPAPNRNAPRKGGRRDE